jgi:hypothetical protein
MPVGFVELAKMEKVGCLGNWRNLPRPREKYVGAGPTYNRLNREKEGR